LLLEAVEEDIHVEVLAHKVLLEVVVQELTQVVECGV
jgi:hypothetical protein